MMYQAFMSYSHAADDKLSPAIQAGLHNLAKRWYQIRAVRVFRDKTSLSANPHLWSSIVEALGQSEYFVLLASPLSAKSPWVQREIQWWLSNRDSSKFIILLTDGELVWEPATQDFDWKGTSALSSNLRGSFSEEPFYVDFRWSHNNDQLSLRHTQFRSAILDIAATIRGVPKDELDGEDVRQHRRTRWLATTAMLGILAFAIAAAWQAVVATRQRHRADAETVEANHQRDRAVKGEKEAETQRDLAEQRRQEAEHENRIAHSRELSVSALGQLNNDPELAMLLAIEAGKVMQTPEAENALQQSLLEAHLRRVIVAHKSNIESVAFSPDGRRLATAGQNGEAKVWDPTTGKLLVSVPAGVSFIRAWFSPNGAFLLTDNNGYQVRIWNATTGQKVSEIGNVDTPSVSPDSKLVVTISVGRAVVSEVETGRQVRELNDAGIKEAAFSPDGKRIVTAGDSKKVSIWDVATGNVVSTMTGLHAQFSQRGDMIVTTADDNTARLWNTESGKLWHEISVEKYAIPTFGPSSNGLIMFQGSKSALFWNITLNEEAFVLQERNLVFSSDGVFVANTRGIWNAKTGDKVATLYAPRGVFGTSVAFSQDGRNVVTGYSDGTTRIWATGYQANLVDLQFPELSKKYSVLGVKPILSATITPDGLRIVGGTIDGRIAAWDRQTGRQLWATAADAENSIEAITVSPNGKLVASASKDQTARVWDIDGHQLAVLKGHSSWVVGVEFSPDSKWLLTASYDKTARIWNPVTGTLAHVLAGHKDGIFCAHFNPTAAEVVTCDLESASLWDSRSGKLIHKLSAPGITQASFSSTGDYLATSSNGHNGKIEVCLWEPNSGRKIAVVPGAGEAVFGPDPKYLLTFEDRVGRVRDWQAGLVFTEFPEAETGDWSRNGLFVLTANKFGQVRIWSATTGEAVMDFPAQAGTENIAHFSPDGRLVMVTSIVGTGIYVCEVCVSFDEMMKLAEQRVTRKLSTAEKTVYLHQQTTPNAEIRGKESSAPSQRITAGTAR